MKLRLGTRGSQLALVQASAVRDALMAWRADISVEIVEVRTSGDQKQGTPQAIYGDKRDWISGLEEALVEGEIDFALHSSKDVPNEINESTTLLPVLRRANAFDALVSKKHLLGGPAETLADLAQGAMVGTSSLRRKAQLLRLRPDLNVVGWRGNVPTRVQKLKESDDCDAIVLASAGLLRLDMKDCISSTFGAEELLPAVNQGTFAVQYMSVDEVTGSALEMIVDSKTSAAWDAERGFVSVIGADCNSAVGVFAEVEGEEVFTRACVLSHDGVECLEAQDRAPVDDAETSGQRVGDKLLELGAARLLAIE